MRARAGRGLVGLVREAKDPNPKKNIEPEHYSKPATLCVDPGAEGDFWGQINPRSFVHGRGGKGQIL